MITFSLKRGDTWNQSFYWKQGSATGEPVSLLDSTARLQLRNKDDELVIDATPYLTVSGAEGGVLVSVPASETVSFPIGNLLFDIEITFVDGTVKSTETMQLKVIEDITLP